MNFAKFLRTPFLTEHLRWLLLFFSATSELFVKALSNMILRMVLKLDLIETVSSLFSHLKVSVKQYTQNVSLLSNVEKKEGISEDNQVLLKNAKNVHLLFFKVVSLGCQNSFTSMLRRCPQLLKLKYFP